MSLLDNSLLTVLLTLTATFLGLSIVVQVIQELYKYLRSSKSRLYLIALQDFIGSLAFEILKPGVLSDIRVRGPLQFKRVRSKGMVLPLKKEELTAALEKTSPILIKQTLDQLKSEVEYQSGKEKHPSKFFSDFFKKLDQVEKGTTGYWNKIEIQEFFNNAFEIQGGIASVVFDLNSENKTDTKKEVKIDAKILLTEFSKKFIPHIEEAKKNFSQFEKNFEYTYVRANRRLTFVIALLLAFIFNLGIDELYKKSLITSPAEAIKLAEATIQIYEQKVASQDSLIKKNLELANQVMLVTLSKESGNQNTLDLVDFSKIPNKINLNFLVYLLNCIITSILITFGAPFWNDIVSALLKIQKGKSGTSSESSSEEKNG